MRQPVYSIFVSIQGKNDIHSSVHHFFLPLRGLGTKRQGCVTRFPGFCSFSSGRAMPSLSYSTTVDFFSVYNFAFIFSCHLSCRCHGEFTNSHFYFLMEWSTNLQCSIHHHALIYTLLHICCDILLCKIIIPYSYCMHIYNNTSFSFLSDSPKLSPAFTVSSNT